MAIRPNGLPPFYRFRVPSGGREHAPDLGQHVAALGDVGVRCLGRLRERCDKKLSRDDPRRRAVHAAYDAAFTLRLKVHYLECDAAERKRRS